MPNLEGVISIALVCEAGADAEIAAKLADRVLLGMFPYLKENLDGRGEFRGLSRFDPYLKWSQQKQLVRQLNLPRYHGHFDGKPGEPDALAAYRMLLVLDRATDRPDAVILLRDSDDDKRRRAGLKQARTEHPWKFAIVIGLAHTKRECWVIAGFQPYNESEQTRLDTLRQELGFDPRSSAERLTAQLDSATKSAKRVLATLSNSDYLREAQCYILTPLADLQKNGVASGLTAFLEELRTLLAPLFKDREYT